MSRAITTSRCRRFRKPDGAEVTSSPRPKVTASSAQKNYPAAKAMDDDERTMWVSDGWKPGDAPTLQRPEWLQLEFPQRIETETLWIVPKSPYGPRKIEIQTSADGKTFGTLKKHALRRDGEAIIPLPPTRTQILRVLVTASYAAENTQIAEVALEKPVRRMQQSELAIKSGPLPVKTWVRSAQASRRRWDRRHLIPRSPPLIPRRSWT